MLLLEDIFRFFFGLFTNRLSSQPCLSHASCIPLVFVTVLLLKVFISSLIPFNCETLADLLCIRSLNVFPFISGIAQSLKLQKMLLEVLPRRLSSSFEARLVGMSSRRSSISYTSFEVELLLLEFLWCDSEFSTVRWLLCYIQIEVCISCADLHSVFQRRIDCKYRI